jgi:phosphoglycolate phosphatase
MNTRSAPETPLALRFGAIAFDFDGTLADTSEAIVESAAKTLSDLGHPPLDRAHCRSLIGIPLRDSFLESGVAPSAVTDAITRYREVFPIFRPSVRLYPGVRECLERLRAHNIRLGIVSSRSRTSLLDLVTHLELDHYFEAILGEEDAVRHKPAPELVLRLAELFLVTPKEILVVGDTTYDIVMGQQAGSHTVAVTYGNQTRSQLMSSSPSYFADSLEAIWTAQP